MDKDRQIYKLHKEGYEKIVEALKGQIELKGVQYTTIKGEPGKDAVVDYEKIKKDVLSQIKVPDPIPGEPGKDAVVDYDRLESFLQKQVSGIKIPVPKAIPGKKGEPGKDAVVDYDKVIKLVTEQVEVDYEKIEEFIKEEIGKIELPQTRVLNSGGPTTRLGELVDINLSGLQNNQSIKWNGTEWVPFTPGSGGGSSISVDGSEVTDPDFVDTGDINFSASGSDVSATIKDDTVGLDELSATGTPSSSTFLRGDNTWATPAGSATALDGLSDVTLTSEADNDILQRKSGTFVNRTMAQFADDIQSELIITESQISDLGSYITDISTFDTDDLSEGSTNKYNVTHTGDATGATSLSVVALRGVGLDSTVGSPTDGKILVYRSAGSDWVLEDKPAPNPAIDDITDVSITSVADNELLAYDNSSGEWINQTPAEAGFATVSTTGSYNDLSDTPTIPDSLDDLTGSTTDVTEGTNLYFTDERAQDAVGTIFSDSSEIDFTYTDATPSITASIVAGSIDESKLDTSVNASLDLADSALQNINSENINDLSDVTITSLGTDELLFTQDGSTFINQTLAEAGISAVGHTHTESDITDLGNYITASSTDTLTNKSGSNSQWTNDEGYITATLTQEQVEDYVGGMVTGNTETLISVTYEDADGTLDFVVNDDLSLYDNTTSGFITDYTVTEGDVTAHEGALTITESQISDLGSYITASEVVMSKAITIESPTDSEDITMFFTDDAITVTQMNAVVANGSDTPSVTWTIRHSSDRSAAGNEVVTSGTTTTSASTGSEVTSFNDATIPAGSWVWVETTAQSGTVPELSISVEYNRD